MFLQFIDVIQPYRDCVYLDFYCFCLGSFLVTNTAQNTLFYDVYDEEKPPEYGMVTGSLAIDLAKKVLYTVSEGNVADGFIRNLKEELKIGDDLNVKVSTDKVLDYLKYRICSNIYIIVIFFMHYISTLRMNRLK